MDAHNKPNTPALDSYWMPFTANRQFKAAPRLLASAEGMHYTSVDGRRILDGTAGLWCVNAGHGRRQIAAAAGVAEGLAAAQPAIDGAVIQLTDEVLDAIAAAGPYFRAEGWPGGAALMVFWRVAAALAAWPVWG